MFEYSSIPQITDLRKCRLCFNNKTALIQIFETSGSLNEVARTISEVLNFEVSTEDHFPPFVCSLCSEKLFSFKAFKAKCYSLRESYQQLLQSKAESIRKVYGGISAAENRESKVFLERAIAEPNPEEVAPYNVAPLPIKVENSVDDGGTRISEQTETEQVPNDSAFNVSEFPIKTELVEEEDEVEISEQAAEMQQVPKREDDSFQSSKQVWYQMHQPEGFNAQSSNYLCATDQRGAGETPGSSSYHLDRFPSTNRKLGAGGEAMYPSICSNSSGMGFSIGATDMTRKMVDGRDAVHSEGYGYHRGSFYPENKEMIRENPPHLREKEWGGWQMENARAERSGENRIVSSGDMNTLERNSGVYPRESSADNPEAGASAEMVNEKELVKCHHCGESKLTKDELKGHIYRVHSSLFQDEIIRELNGRVVRRQRCALCLKDFKGRADLVTHFMTHTGEKPFLCKICGYRTNSNSYLTVHIRKHTGEKPFKCTVCEFSATDSLSLRKHVRKHTGERPYKCTVCTYCASSNSHLRQHMRIHTGERPYKCTMCQYSSRQSTALKAHILTHSKEKPFKCHVCSMGYMSNASLKIHVRLHTGEKPFQCNLCEFRTKARSSLRKHIASHARNAPLKDKDPERCKTCGYTAAPSTSLKQHVCNGTGESCADSSKDETSSDKHIAPQAGTVLPITGVHCQVCGYTAPPGMSLDQHVCKRQMGENSSAVSLDKQMLTQAGTVPMTNEPLKCKVCEYTAPPGVSLDRHVCKRTCELGENSSAVSLDKKMFTQAGTGLMIGSELLKCNICEYTAAPGMSLDQHVCKLAGGLCEDGSRYGAPSDECTATHAGTTPLIAREPLKCEAIDYTADSGTNLEQHVSNGTGEFGEDSWRDEASLNNHVVTQVGTVPVDCTACEYTAVPGTSGSQHVFDKYSGVPTPIPVSTWDPSNCGNAINGADSLQCQKCGFTAAPGTTLKYHLCKSKAEKPYKCEQCSYSCVKKDNLKLHMRVHTGEKVFKCGECSYSTVYSHNFKVHMRLHTGEKPHKCHICDFGAVSSAALNVHIMKHTGEKPHKCEMCDYSTADRACLKQHMRRHTGERPFKCNICDFSSADRTHLKAHINRHTGERPYKCHICHYSATYRGTLNVHLRRHERDREIAAGREDKR